MLRTEKASRLAIRPVLRPLSLVDHEHAVVDLLHEGHRARLGNGKDGCVIQRHGDHVSDLPASIETNVLLPAGGRPG